MKPPRLTLEEIVNRIVDEKKLTRKEVFDLIEKKKGLLGRMISDEGAAEIVAKELGIKIYPLYEEDELTLTIADLVPGMSNVTITGRVIKAGPIREFVDKVGGKGTVANLMISDKNGEMRAVLWGEAANLVQNGAIKESDIVRIHDGYVREDTAGRTELHVGRRGRVEIRPLDVVEADFPNMSGKQISISELRADMSDVDIDGTIRAVNAPRVVKTKEGRDVKLASLIMQDKAGATIRVVLWDDRTSLAESAQNGDHIEIISGRVRINRNGETEIHTGSMTKVEIHPTRAPSTASANDELTKISELKLGMRNFLVEGYVSGEPKFSEYTRADVGKGKIYSFNFSDDKSTIRVVAWGENAEILRKINKGDTIRIKDSALKLGIRGDLEIHIRSADAVRAVAGKDSVPSKIDAVGTKATQEKTPDHRIARKHIYALEDGETAEIRGMITKINTKSPIYRACPKCLRKIELKEGVWLCSRDGNIEKPSIRVLYSLTLDDGTGAITCTLSGAPAEKLLGLEAADMLPDIDREKDFSSSRLTDMVGKEMVFIGRCSLNTSQNRKEFRVTSVAKPDPRAEAKILLERIKNYPISNKETS